VDAKLGLTAALLHDNKFSSRTDKEDSILSSDSKSEKEKSGMQAMSWGTLVGKGVQPVRRGIAN
jgi:hypothetical protein